MPDGQHVHFFSGETSYEYGHLHRYQGYTGPAVGQGLAHTHRIRVITTVELGHDHLIDVETGPGIATAGGHVHEFRGVTSISGRPPHSHRFRNVTGPPIPTMYGQAQDAGTQE
ncbi:MAG TPA: hypothetical protein GXX25_11740 [Desulfotomaculum sp.]|nr:YmaF family protein [Desulfofundulus thermobenzoicus]HHW44454.1 hypothetical protein [Desulfotomaculum sp.]